MNASVSPPPSAAADELRSVITHAERLIQSLEGSGEDAIVKLRARATQAVTQAKNKLQSVQSRTRDTVMEAAQVADDYVRENPWQTIAVGVVFGMVVGALVARRS